ncbi:MAG: hypothetical protein VX683_06200, partial [Cyanobacteriota bacterium]|nr:hypothetical protein [Cyanobacteriota bacterium]
MPQYAYDRVIVHDFPKYLESLAELAGKCAVDVPGHMYVFFNKSEASRVRAGMEEDGAQASDLLAFSLAKSWAELHMGRPDRDAWAGLAAYLDFGLSPIALFDSDITSTSSMGGMTGSSCSHVETPAPVLLDFSRVIEAIRTCLQLNPVLELTLANVISMASIGKLPNEVDKHCVLENREALTRLRDVLAATRHAGVAPVDVVRAVRAASHQGALILKEHRHHSQVTLAHATAQATIIQVRL